VDYGLLQKVSCVLKNQKILSVVDVVGHLKHDQLVRTHVDMNWLRES
jgi:hypothetical protein